MSRIPVYIAHPLNSGNRQANLRSARHWVAWLAWHYAIVPVADWITLASVWPETRAEGLEIDVELVKLCGRIILCGPRVTEKMALELSYAESVCDLTGDLGSVEIARRMAAAGYEQLHVFTLPIVPPNTNDPSGRWA